MPGYAVATWYGMVYPAGTPQPIVDKTSKALQEILARPAIQEQMAKVGARARYMTPAEFTAHLDNEVATWKYGARKGQHPAKLESTSKDRTF